MYAPEKDALVWKIKNFPGGREFLLRCKFGLPSVAAEEETQGRLPPIKVKFEVRGWSLGARQRMRPPPIREPPPPTPPPQPPPTHSPFAPLALLDRAPLRSPTTASGKLSQRVVRGGRVCSTGCVGAMFVSQHPVPNALLQRHPDKVPQGHRAQRLPSTPVVRVRLHLSVRILTVAAPMAGW